MTKLAPDSTFALEADDLLTKIEDAALALDCDTADPEPVHLLFRAFHTIKGSAAMVGLTDISSFTHHVESALEQVREGKTHVSPDLVRAILEAKDHITHLLSCAMDGSPKDVPNGQRIVADFARLTTALHSPAAAPAQAAAEEKIRTTFWITFRLGEQSTGTQITPEALLADLGTLGLLELFESGAEGSQDNTWRLSLTTELEAEAVLDVFLLTPEGTEISLERGLSEFVSLPPPAETPTPTPTPEPGPEPPPAPPTAAPKPPPSAASSSKATGSRGQDTVRVSSQRLDQLMKLVGELVINQSRLQQAQSLQKAPEMTAPVESMERLINELRESVFGVRMMPIGPTFARFRRLTHDLCRDLNKEVEFTTAGNDTELDKTVLEQLTNPLVHIIRNSMDHGIESPDERVAQGKPRKGQLILKAEHEGSQVAITLQDDGRGLDASRIRQKAIDKGLIDPNTKLSEQETLELIMRPGFSTAQTVTEVSGRGVGMDAVKKTVEGLRGNLSLTSIQGSGTTIRLILPLTLAIVDGLVVEVGNECFIVPMMAIRESEELSRSQRAAKNGRNAVAVRGELIPYVHLRELFASTGEEREPEMIVIVNVLGQHIGLVVDRVLGLHQTVIQPLGAFCRDISLFSGSTIMGDGRVVLILDLAGILQQAERLFSAQHYGIASHEAA